PDLALARLDVAADQVEGRGLAGAVGADDGMTLALRDAQIEVADDADIAEALLDGFDFDGCGHARYPRSRAIVAARSQASATRRQLMRAMRKPPTTSTAATARVRGLVASKGAEEVDGVALALARGVARDRFDREN